MGSRTFADIVNGDWRCNDGWTCEGIVIKYYVGFISWYCRRWASIAVGVDDRRAIVAMEAGEYFYILGCEHEYRYDGCEGHRGGARVQGGPPPC